MVFSSSLKEDASAQLIETAVEDVLAAVHRTGDIAKEGEATIGTTQMCDEVINALNEAASEKVA